MMDKNYARMLRNFKSRLGIKSAEELNLRISVLPSEEWNIIVARWGICDGYYCPTYQELDKKLNIHNAKSLYSKAEQSLRDARFVLMLKDHDKLPFSIAKNVGILGCALLHTQQCNIYGEKLWNCIQKLSIDMRDVIESRFGLVTGEVKTSSQIAFMYDIPVDEVKRLEYLALRKLNSWQSDFIS